MTDKTIIDTYNYYFGYHIVKLGLDKKYKFIIKKDNRINALAEVTLTDKIYTIKFNTKTIKHKWQIIHIVLHELRHITDDFRETHGSEHEFEAEYFALSTAKIEYPKYYRRMVNWTKRSLKKENLNKEHIEGYTMALQKLGEI